ncbi:MAG: glycosyltransferase family 1 protein [Desulfobacteraceae bacterium]|nr:glycosyltransferase family 1 protein [Desulfobacteraceae bacterium]
MRIGIQTWGTEGDIRPLAALAAGLSTEGHEVTLVATSVENKNYAHLGTTSGFRVQHAGQRRLSPRVLNNTIAKILGTVNPLRQLEHILVHLFDPVVEEMLEAAYGLAADNDLVIGHFLVHPLVLAAEKHRRPHITVATVPLLPSMYFAPAGMPDFRATNEWIWAVAKFLINAQMGKRVNGLRKREGLPAVRQIMHRVWASPVLNLIAVSPSLCESPPDWEERHCLSGFLNLPASADPWRIPSDLQNFFKAGPPPVFMGFGSMTTFADRRRLETATRIMCDAAVTAGCRAIVQSNWDGIENIPKTPDIYQLTDAPHLDVFPRCAMVVHHGGAGTTQSATLAGCPSIVVPHAVDQVFWASKLRRIGIAPRQLLMRRLTVNRLTKRIRQVIGDPAMKRRAEQLGEKMKNENGVETAIKHIEKAVKAH